MSNKDTVKAKASQLVEKLINEAGVAEPSKYHGDVAKFLEANGFEIEDEWASDLGSFSVSVVNEDGDEDEIPIHAQVDLKNKQIRFTADADHNEDADGDPVDVVANYDSYTDFLNILTSAPVVRKCMHLLYQDAERELVPFRKSTTHKDLTDIEDAEDEDEE